MARVLNSFKVRLGDEQVLSSGKSLLDYRLGEKLNLSKIKSFFQRSYNVKKLWHGSRHVLGILTKNDTNYFLKLSTSEGISIVTKNEYEWNNYFNQYFPKNFLFSVPKNYDSGLYRNKYFYLITDYFKGKLLCDISDTYKKSNNLIKYNLKIIELSELIQKIPMVGFTNYEEIDYRTRFTNKVSQWFNDIPINIRKKFKVETLLNIVEKGVSKLSSKPRHGDFTPWHIIKLTDSRLGLIDGEHFLPDGVEGYDICYFIQRVFSILKNPQVALDIYSKLLIKGYRKDILKPVLAARAIGGFLDESLTDKSDYNFANDFKDWVIGV